MKRTEKTPRLGKEVMLEAKNLSNPEARMLSANYYASQEMRKRMDMQLRHLGEQGIVREKTALMGFASDQFCAIENEIHKVMKVYADSHVVGRWMMAQFGLGPVIATGLLAHLDIVKAATAGSFWRFAGLDPTCKWEKGQKRPYNAELKQLTYHLGECFKRVSGNSLAFYGQYYKEEKERVVAKNDAGANMERSQTFFTKSADVKKVLATGKLPDGNLDRQACNNTVKLFLSHLHAVMYYHHFGKPAPKPFAISVLGHAHEIKVPHADEFFPGFSEASYGNNKKKKVKRVA